MNRPFFIEVDHFQRGKHGEHVAGDDFQSQKVRGEDRVISVLSDGLGSGVKACVLATLTTTMATHCVLHDLGAQRTAGLIMETLPVCKTRRIGYSTFTIVDVTGDGDTRVIEYENPPALLLRGATVMTPEKRPLAVKAGELGARRLAHFRFAPQAGDRVVLCSDGIVQSGMGSADMPLGWGEAAAREFIMRQVASAPDVSARTLARRLVDRAAMNDGDRPKDDMTCAVIYFRKPRRLLVVSGPPFDGARDAEVSARLSAFDGRKVVCGGTTAQIIARELKRPVTVDMRRLDPDIPPMAVMEGMDLVTEGYVTLSHVAEWLETCENPDPASDNGAVRLLNLLLDSDIIEFIVGTRINEAHQNPSVPVHLDIRRNVVRRICAALEQKHLKETQVRFV